MNRKPDSQDPEALQRALAEARGALQPAASPRDGDGLLVPEAGDRTATSLESDPQTFHFSFRWSFSFFFSNRKRRAEESAAEEGRQSLPSPNAETGLNDAGIIPSDGIRPGASPEAG